MPPKIKLFHPWSITRSLSLSENVRVHRCAFGEKQFTWRVVYLKDPGPKMTVMMRISGKALLMKRGLFLQIDQLVKTCQIKCQKLAENLQRKVSHNPLSRTRPTWVTFLKNKGCCPWKNLGVPRLIQSSCDWAQHQCKEENTALYTPQWYSWDSSQVTDWLHVIFGILQLSFLICGGQVLGSDHTCGVAPEVVILVSSHSHTSSRPIIKWHSNALKQGK